MSKKYIVAYRVDMEKNPGSDHARNHSFSGECGVILNHNLLYHSGIFTPKMLKKMGINPNSKESKNSWLK